MQNNLSYRKDIDGLRALAIITVVLFHAKFSTFAGGFEEWMFSSLFRAF